MQKYIMTAALVLSVLILATGCGNGLHNQNIDISDPESSGLVATANDLAAFFNTSSSDTATLVADINLETDMLLLTKERSKIVINGNGHTIYGDAECVIRMDAGCTLILNDVTISGGTDAIGMLGSGNIGGKNANIHAVATGINAIGSVCIERNSKIEVNTTVGYGIYAAGLELDEYAELTVKNESLSEEINGPNAITALSAPIIMGENSRLTASSNEYNVIKCKNSFIMHDSSYLSVINTGEYHGAEIGTLEISGAVTIQAYGGEKGVGIFLVDLYDEIYVLGECSPAPRHENGRGSLNFVDQLPEPTVEPSPTDIENGE